MSPSHLPAQAENPTVPPRPEPDPYETATLPPDGQMAPTDSVSAVELPGYEILRELGRGGMGVVYQARQTALNRVVALKMILVGGHASPEDLARFRTEAEAVARLQHPNIVQIHEVGENNGLPYFSLEFCPGGSLDRKLQGTPLPPAQAAALVETFARAMQAAHDKGVIHRDLKPANVLLADDGTPKVTDFGLAKKLDEVGQTATGAVMGTPSYMAPEQAGGKGKEVGPLADVYALGAILYECLTGRPPFKAATSLDTMFQVLADEPVPPSQLQTKLPRDLETVCLKCLRKEAAKRYSSAWELAEDLRRFQAGEPIRARPVGRLERAAKWVRRNPMLAGMTIVVVLALLGGTGVSLGFGIVAGQQAERATKNEADAVAKGKALVTANDDLKRSRDDLETTLARSWLRPLALQGGDKPMTEPEWEALWELATNRSGRLGYRFVEEASRTPESSRQLRDRAALALSAAVGFDAERRAQVEALLLARLDENDIGDEQKRDLALAASVWDGLSSSAAVRTAAQLNRALKEAKELRTLQQLGQGLSTMANRMEANEASQVATTLVQAMKENSHPGALYGLAHILSALAGRMEAQDAATTTARAATTLVQAMRAPHNKTPHTLGDLADDLSLVAFHMEAKDATATNAQAASILAQAIKETNDPYDLSRLARGLAAVAGRMEAQDAATTTVQAATHLLQNMEKTKNPAALGALAQGLSTLAGRMESRDATKAAARLAQTMMNTKDPNLLQNLAECLSALAGRMEAKDAAQAAIGLAKTMKDTQDPFALPSLLRGLSAVTDRLEAKDAAQTATVLAEALKHTEDPFVLQTLAQGLSAVAAHMDAKDAAIVNAQAAILLLHALKDPKDPLALPGLGKSLSAVATFMETKDAAEVATALVRRMKETKNPNTLRALAQGLSAMAVRMESKDAVSILGQVMRDIKDPYALGWVAHGLSAVAGRMEAQDAMTILGQVMRDTKDPYALGWVAEGLSAMAGCMEDNDAAPIIAQAATALVQAMKETKNPTALTGLVKGLAAVATRMETKDAATTSAQAATVLAQIPLETNSPNQWEQLPKQQLAKGLSELLSAYPPAEIPSRSKTAAFAVAYSAGPAHLLTTLTILIFGAEPAPCRLSSQQLVELLKLPTCIDEVRRVILDQLGNRFRRTFHDQWEFVHFAKEQRLDLDSPAHRNG